MSSQFYKLLKTSFDNIDATDPYKFYTTSLNDVKGLINKSPPIL